MKITTLCALLICLTSCNKKPLCPSEKTYTASYGHTLTVGCNVVTYHRENPECYLSGPYQVLDPDRGAIAWDLKKTCYYDDPYMARCFLIYESDTSVRFSCQTMGIHRVFEELK